MLLKVRIKNRNANKKMNKIKKIISLIITIPIANKVLIRVRKDIEWENRERILKDKSILFKVMWYATHIL